MDYCAYDTQFHDFSIDTLLYNFVANKQFSYRTYDN